MKKSYTGTMIALLLIFCHAAVDAQNTEFAPLGAQWNYKDLDGWGPAGTEVMHQYECVSVDTVAGKGIKTIQETLYSQSLWAPGGWSKEGYTHRDTSYNSYQVYEENDTVFVYNDVFQKYTPLYVFNVNEGDTLRLPITSLGAEVDTTTDGDSVMTLIIDSIRDVNYGGVVEKTYYTSCYVPIDWNNGYDPTVYAPTFNWSYDVNWEYITLVDSNGNTRAGFTNKMRGAYTRLFGGVGQGLLPQNYGIIGLSPFDGYFLLDTITCYSNDSIAFNLNPQYDCDSFSITNRFVGIDEVSALAGVELYPNPARDYITITSKAVFAADTRLQLTDMLGRRLLAPQHIGGRSSYRLSLDGLAAGMYLLVFETGGKRYYKKIALQP